METQSRHAASPMVVKPVKIDANKATAASPLCVDLDGTLLATDSLWESLIRLFERYPLRSLVWLPVWLIKGRAYLKQRCAEHAAIDPESLPYHPNVMAFLEQQKSIGRRLVLTTAANKKVAQTIADHLGLFDEIIATDQHNLKGRAKLEAIQQRYPNQPFDYVGDSQADVSIWQASDKCYAVAPDSRVRRWRQSGIQFEQVFPSLHSMSAVWRLLRPFQWSKNLLLVVPLLLSHQYQQMDKLLSVIGAWVAFSLCASAVYVLNDLLDLEADRRHPTKRHRPLAAGRVGIPQGFVVSLLLLLFSFGLASVVSTRFAAILCGYFALTSAYSFHLKRCLLLDVVALSSLYTIRIIAGGTAASVVVSPWLLGFSMFLFFSLALSKRYAELAMWQERGVQTTARRGYSTKDMETVAEIGIGSGLLSVLVFSIYISESETATHYYPNREFLWFICPLLLYWVTRMWFITKRGELRGDPILFALKDPVSYAVGMLAIVMVLLGASQIINL